MRFGNLVLKNLTRRPARTALTLVALATAITAVVSLFGIAQGFTKAFSDVYEAHGIDIVVSRQGTADRLSSSVDGQFVKQVSKIPGVLKTAGVMLDTLSLEQEGIYGIPTMGIAKDSWMRDSYPLIEAETNLASRPLDSESGPKTDSEALTQPSATRSLLLGVHLAERIGRKAGESVTLFDEQYQVAGVFRSTSAWENGSMILPLETLQQLTDRPGQVTYINVILDRSPDSPASAREVIQAIESMDRRLLALTTSEYVETDTRMQIAHAMAWMTSAIALLIGSIGTLNTMLTSVLERTKEIGILRAIGWPRRRVVGMILGESCGLAIVASILGICFAVLITRLLSQSPAARGLIAPHIDIRAILLGVTLSLVIGLLGATLPALRAARLSPTEAFREH